MQNNERLDFAALNAAKLPLERKVAATQVTLDGARSMGEHELAEMIECDLYQAVALIWDRASPILRRDIIALVGAVRGGRPHAK